MYAAAASAAGVSVLALIPPAEYLLPTGAALVGILALLGVAEAKIVYTPAHIRITGTFSLDLNHDGVTDFKIRVHQYSHSPFFYVLDYASQVEVVPEPNRLPLLTRQQRFC